MKYFKHPKGVRDNYWLFKSIIIMKLTFILTVFFSLQTMAKVYSQQKVTFNVKSADFKKVISAIQKQTNYHFVFSERKIPSTQKITLSVQNEDVTSVLNKVLANTGFTYTQLENNLIVITGKNEAPVAAAVVKGKVLDENGTPAPGVSVRVKGSTTGTITDSNGNFSLNAPDNAVLIFSFLGYENQEVAVAGKSELSVKLTVSAKSLNEVVVTALGIKKDEKKLGYSVTTVGGSALDKAKETNVAYSLEGRVAGLSISGTNGGPGSSARILLRGVTSGNATGPLFVINGVPMDNTQRGQSGEWGGADYGDGISNINPDDIESMTVLKGQSASALYGTRAANGVILITTKSGKKNSGFGVEYNSNYQMDKIVDNTDYQTEYGQGIGGVKPTNANSALNSTRFAWGGKLDGSQAIQFDGKEYAYSKTSDDYTKFYKTGGTFTNTVALTGGNETGAFRLSLSDLNNHAVTPNSGLNRKTFNFNGSQTVMKNLDINLVANYILDDSKNRSGLSDGPGNPNNVQFLAPNVAQSLTKPGVNAAGTELLWTDDTYATNPYFAAYNFVTNTKRERLITSVSARYALTPWAYVQARIGYDKIHDNRLGITPTGTAYLSNPNGSMQTQTTQTTEFNSDVLIGAKHDLIKNFLNLDVSAGGNIRKANTSGTYINANNFIIPYFYDLSNGTTRDSGNQGVTNQQVNSLYYTADFGIKEFLILSTSGRYDTYSSISSTSGRGIFTPSVSASFIFSDLVHVDGLDFGKLRLSYAKTSGSPDPFKNQVYYSVSNSINGINAGSFSNQLPNLFLKPYTLGEFEVGTSLKFFNDRLGLDVAYFAKKTKNEILNSTIDISSGYTNAYVATASTQNRGVEIELHGTPVKTSSFSWNPSFNFTYVKNKVLSTNATNANVSLGTYRPLNATTAFVVGMDGPQILAYDYKRDASGAIVYKDGVPQQGTYKPYGSVIPKFYGGFNNDFNYKNFNLSFLVDYRFGNKVLSATSYYSIYRGLNKITLPGREGGIVGAGVDAATGTTNTTNATAQAYYQALATVSSVNVLDGSFIKLRQVSLGYSIPKTFIANTPFNSITFSLVARNLWTIMKHTDNIDPESNFAPGVNYAGIEGTSVPAVRTYGFNVNFKFKK
jgi:TonB-linked SusC/RagA family outer membrane protein